MSLILEGTINGMRPVSGKITQGKNKGSFWHFLSMEVCDARFGQIYSCQLRQEEKELFKKFIEIRPGQDENGNKIEIGHLLQDWSGHNVKLLLKGISAGERKLPAKSEDDIEESIIQVRFYIAGMKDLGLPKNDDF